MWVKMFMFARDMFRNGAGGSVLVCGANAWSGSAHIMGVCARQRDASEMDSGECKGYFGSLAWRFGILGGLCAREGTDGPVNCTPAS